DQSGPGDGGLALGLTVSERPSTEWPSLAKGGREKKERRPNAVGRRWPLPLRVFGRLPVIGARACTEAGVRKASREETAGEFAPAVVFGLWGFSAGVCFDVSSSSREGRLSK